MKKTWKTGIFIIIIGITFIFTFTTCENTVETDYNPKTAHFNIEGEGTVYFDGSEKEVTITAKRGNTNGEITVYYEGIESESYPKTTAAPFVFGTYNITFDVGAIDKWYEAIGLSAGTLIIADGTPDAPTNVSTEIQSASSIKISWDSVSRAETYEIYYITTGMTEIELVETTTANSFTHFGLTQDNTYHYYITAENSYGVSNYSAVKSIKLGTPIASNKVEATVISISQINLNWSAVTGANGYKVYRATTQTGDKTLVGTYTTASCSATGLLNNTTYYFFVAATNAIGEGSYSTAVSAKTLIGNGPKNLTATVIKSNTGDFISLSWTSTAEYFRVYCATGSPTNAKNKVVDFWTSTTFDSVIFQDIQPNTTYYYWVTSVSLGNYGVSESEYSEMVSVKTGTGSSWTLPPTTGTTTAPPSGGGTGQKLCPNKSSCVNGKCGFNIYFTSYCSGGTMDCTTCSGKGIYNNQVCSSCRGAKKVTCPICNGTGKCKLCKGTGKV